MMLCRGRLLEVNLKHSLEVSTRSRVFNRAVSNWIDSMEPEKREMFVNTLFDIITSSGAKNLSDIYDKHLI